MSLGLVLYQILKSFSFVFLFGEYTPISSKGYQPEVKGLCDLFPLCVARACSPRATHEGNESHNHELKAVKWLIFTLVRIPQGMQKYTEEKFLYCSSFFFFQHTLLALGGFTSFSAF